MIFAGLSYTCAAVAMAVLSGFLVTRYRHNDLARRVAMVCAVSAIWAGVLAFSGGFGDRRPWIEIGMMGLRYAGWLFALSTPNARSFHPWIVRGGFLLCSGLALVALVGALMVSIAPLPINPRCCTAPAACCSPAPGWCSPSRWYAMRRRVVRMASGC
jgi:hypothetical protein